MAMRSLCYIYGCDRPIEGYVRNRGTGKELGLCVSHLGTYLLYPMIEQVQEPDDDSIEDGG